MQESRRRILTLPFALLGQWGCISPRTSAQEKAASPAYRFQVPVARPRLWWTPERLALARQSGAARRFTPRRDDPVGYAWRYLLKGDASDARKAIDWAMQVTFRTDRTSSNEARWFGEPAILIYDWAHDQFTAEERQVFTGRWNGYIEALRAKDWGGPGMPQSNYFWGYFRNEIEWGIASYHENPKAPSFLNDTMRVRWRDSFVQNANGPARGGVPVEGSQYGRYLLQYASVPLVSAQFSGYPMLKETNFFTEAMFWLIYATLPAPTARPSGGSARWEVFPMGDDEFFRHGGSAEAAELGTYAAMLTGLWGDLSVGQYARYWLNMTGASRPHFVAAAEGQGAGKDFSALPLDYYAPGSQHLYARTSWKRDATAVHLQLGAASGGSHEHYDHGNWQIWRNGRWLSRETTGYTDRIAGYAGNGIIETSQSAAHNGLLLNGNGLAHGYRNGPPVVKRLERRDEYVYAAVDLTPSYRNDHVRGRRPERDNAAAAHVGREFVFLRPLETLVIFDRVQSARTGVPAEAVTKTFLAHFEQNPVLEASGVVKVVNGDQALHLVTVVPAEPVRRVVAEGGTIGQYRLEIETQGSEHTWFLHVLQARGASEAAVAVDLEETAEEFILMVQHPRKGNARLVFGKHSLNGTGLQFAHSHMPVQVSPLSNRVQGIRVTSDGPQWETLPA